MTELVVRKMFYAAVCFVTLCFGGWGAVTLSNANLKKYFLTESGRSYSVVSTEDKAKVAEHEEAEKKNLEARWQEDLAWAGAVLPVSLFLFFIFYPKLEDGDSEKDKN